MSDNSVNLVATKTPLRKNPGVKKTKAEYAENNFFLVGKPMPTKIAGKFRVNCSNYFEFKTFKIIF